MTRRITPAIKYLTVFIAAIICVLLWALPSYANYQTYEKVNAKKGATAVIYGDMSSDCWALMYNLPNFAIVTVPKERMAPFLSDYFRRQLDGEIRLPYRTYGLTGSEYQHIGLTASKITAYNIEREGGSVTYEDRWGTVYGIYNTSNVAPLAPLADSNRVHSKFDNYVYTNGTTIDDNDVEYINWEYALVLNSIKKAANDYETAVIHDYGDAGADMVANEYEYNVVTGKVFPDSYSDLVYPSSRDLAALCPWYTYYTTSIGRDYWGDMKWSISSIPSETAQTLFNRYNNSGVYTPNQVNALWNTLLGTNNTFLSNQIYSYYYLGNPNYYNWWVKGELTDLVATDIPTNAIKIVDHSSDRWDGGSSNYYDIYTKYEKSCDLVSTWQVSNSNDESATWYTIASNVAGEYKSYEFNIIDHCFKIGGKVYAMPSQIANSSTWYIRRISSSSQYGGTLTSPSQRIRTGLTLDGIDVVALKEVVEMGYLQPKDVKLTVHYSTGDKVMSGNGSYITYYGTQIFAVGQNANVVYYTFTDPETGGVLKGYFHVSGKKKKPISITAHYEGDDVVEGMSYKLLDLIVNITYDNGTMSTFRAQDNASVGTYKTKSYGKGDVDENGVLNSADLQAFDVARTTANLTASKFAQADWDGDGTITDKDRKNLADVIDRSYKDTTGEKTFYAAFSGLANADGSPVYASFKVKFVRKSPYSLYMVQQPAKTKYIEGENFDPTGMILAVYYNNGDIKEINYDGLEDANGVTIGTKDYPAKNLSAEQTKVVVSYTENDQTVTADVQLNIVEASLTSLRVERAPDTTVYYSGENFRTTGMDVYAYFDESVEGHSNDRVLLEANEYTVENGKRLSNSTDYVVILADTITDANRETNGYVKIKKNRLENGDDIEIGDSGTFEYTTGVELAGECVGNEIITLSYTFNGVTKKAFVPIVVYGRRLSALNVLSMPYTTEYMAGQDFDTTGLILKANYTDGTLDYLYADTPSKPGYIILNGEDLAPGNGYVIAQYTESDITLETEVPITVLDPTISSMTANYVGTPVYVNNSYNPHDVQIVITYTNGTTTSFRADERGADGVTRVRLIPFDDENLGADVDYKLYTEGRHKFAALYAGLVAEFSVEAIGNPAQEDFTASIAKSRYKYSYWTETFTAVKIQSVSDFIRGHVNAELTGDNTVAAASGLASTNPRTNEDTRSYLSYSEGTGQYDPTNLSNPSQTFTRQGGWRYPETVVSVEYRGRTFGYLFPDSSVEAFRIESDEDTPYIDAYHQDRATVRSATDVGWTDWMQNGDSAGTVNAGRIAYNYTGTGGDTTYLTMALDRLEIRLKNIPDGDDPKLVIYYTDTSGVAHDSLVASGTEVQLVDPQKIKINLDGNITVTNANGVTESKPFGEVYKIYYRASTNDVEKWSQGGVENGGAIVTDGEYAGYDGTPMQNIEIRIMLKDTDFLIGGSSTAPVISEQPRNAQVRIGYPAVFSINAIGNALSYQWYKDGEAIEGATSSIYTHGNAQKSDSGSIFYCIVTDHEGHSTTSSQVTLTVTDVSPVLTTDLSDVTAQANAEVTLRVSATCLDPSSLSYYWEMTTNTGAWQSMPNNGNEAMTFTASSDMHGRNIRCRVSNTAGSVYSNTCLVSCLDAPTLEIETPTLYVCRNGSEFVTFTAVATTNATGGLKYQWSVNDVQRQGETSSTMNFLPSTVGSYTISCTATDKYNHSTTKSVVLHVGELPTVSLKTTITLDGTYTVEVKATTKNTSSSSVYTWAYDNQTVADASAFPNITISGDHKKLTITDLSSGEQHTVQLKVENAYGSKIEYIGFTVK